MKQVTDISDQSKAEVDRIISENPDQVAKAKINPKLSRMVRRSGTQSDWGEG